MSETNSDQTMQRDVVLYTRRGCHLCEVAELLLSQEGVAPQLVDIDGDPALRARFDTCVPVVEIAGRVRFRGRVDRVLLRRILRSDGDHVGDAG